MKRNKCAFVKLQQGQCFRELYEHEHNSTSFHALVISLGINSTTEPFATTRWGSGEIKGAGAHNHQQRDWSLTAGGIGEMNNYQFTCSCDCHLYWLLLRDMQHVIQFSESEQLGYTTLLLRWECAAGNFCRSLILNTLAFTFSKYRCNHKQGF